MQARKYAEALYDTYWPRAVVGCGAGLAPWLRDRGSLTQRIRRRCTTFMVRPLRSGLARIAYDEAALLGLSPQSRAWSREVFLYADGRPVVFAHSACAPQHLRGAWSGVVGLGGRPLGELLFSHPQVERRPLHYRALSPRHPLFRSAAAVLGDAPIRLWARRSLFTLHGAPLLVTEVFLPGVLRLDGWRLHSAA